MILTASINPDPVFVSLCSKMAPMASMGLFLAPMGTMRQVVMHKSVGSLPLLPHTTMISNAFLWITYGALKHEPSVWASNGVGILFSIFYFMQFVQHSPKESPTLPGTTNMHVQACLTAILTITSIAVALPSQSAAATIGYIGVAFCMMLNASPLVAIKTVIENKSAESIPLSFTLASIACCFFWAVVGHEQMHDWVVYFPNIVGLSFGLVQLTLKLMYSNEKSSAAEIAM